MPSSLSSPPSLSLRPDYPHRLALRLTDNWLQTKLLVPLLPATICCRCGCIIDIHGDHLFSCAHDSKANLHKRFRHSPCFTLSHIAPLVQLDNTSVDIEPSRLVPQFANIRPADTTIRLQPRTLPQHLLDFTIILSPARAAVFAQAQNSACTHDYGL